MYSSFFNEGFDRFNKHINPRTCILAFLIALFFGQTALAQTCPGTGPEADPQLGCPEPFYATVSKPAISNNVVRLNITVENRRIAFPPDCPPGECYDNLNYQGLPLCEGWSGELADVKVVFASCYPDCDLQGCPDCDFNVSVAPPGPQNIGNAESLNFTVEIISFEAQGGHDFAFAALLSSVKKRIFSLRLNISDQPSGVEGDNAPCPACASEKCDSEPIACGYACKGSAFCSEPECSFDTPFAEAAQSCCGDDSGEVFRRCYKSSQIGWSCPAQAACCGQEEDCVHSGNCYREGRAYLLGAGGDEYSYCSGGVWNDCDGSLDMCSACGFSWNNSACCGDDSEEYFRSRICLSGCETNMTDRSCCMMGSACVLDGQCHATGEVVVLGGKNLTCEGGAWYEKASNQSACYKGECNKRDSCEGPCPACIFKDFSCYGTNCEADYIDPDMHWTYCQNCSQNWSDSGGCCGDDEKEYWVQPCPKANASAKCCSNPGERVNGRGECVISCGIAMRANASVLEESLIQPEISVSPAPVEVEAGKAADFSVMVKADDHPLHNVMLGLCGPFSFEASPQAIGEIGPGETGVFAVRLAAAPDSVPGPWGFSVYVSSNELVHQRKAEGLASVVVPGYPSYDVYLYIAAGMAAAYLLKKLISRRKGRPGPAKAKPEKGRKAGPRGRKDAARSKLADLVREELDRGTPEKELRDTLASNGISRTDIDAAFRRVKRSM